MKAFMKINCFLLSFTSFRQNMKINSNHPCQYCLTEPNYLQCRGSYVLGHSGVSRSSSPRARPAEHPLHLTQCHPLAGRGELTSKWSEETVCCENVILNIIKRVGNIFYIRRVTIFIIDQ